MDNNVSMTALMSAFAIAYQNEFKNSVLRGWICKKTYFRRRIWGDKKLYKERGRRAFSGKKLFFGRGTDQLCGEYPVCSDTCGTRRILR